jgi:hypothetical protein
MASTSRQSKPEMLENLDRQLQKKNAVLTKLQLDFNEVKLELANCQVRLEGEQRHNLHLIQRLNEFQGRLDAVRTEYEEREQRLRNTYEERILHLNQRIEELENRPVPTTMLEEEFRTATRLTQTILVDSLSKIRNELSTTAKLDKMTFSTFEKVLQEKTEAIRAATESMLSIIDQNLEPTMNECADYLRMKTSGLSVTDRTVTMLSSMAREYLKTRAPVRTDIQYHIFKSGIQDVLLQYSKNIPNWNTLEAEFYNDSTMLKKRKVLKIFGYTFEWAPFTETISSGNGSGASITSVHTKSLLKLLGWISIASIPVICFIIRRYIVRTASSTTLKTTKVLNQAWNADTNQSSLTNIIQSSSPLSSIFENSNPAIVNNSVSLQTKNFSNPLMTSPSVSSTLTSLTDYIEEDEFKVLSNHLSKLKKAQLINGNLPDLYKHVIQHSMLPMENTSNQSSNIARNSYNLAKEHMTKLPGKSISCPENTSTTTNVTIHHSTPTSLSKCLNYVTDSTSRAIQTTKNLLGSRVAPLTTRLTAAMDTITRLGERACRETSTRALETASSIIISLVPYLTNLASEERLSLMEMIQSSSQIPDLIQTPLDGLPDFEIWDLSWTTAIAPLYTRLIFAEAE